MTNLEALLSGYSCDASRSDPMNSGFNNLVANLKLLSTALNVDGIDFDFEPGGGNPYNPSQQRMVSQFTCVLHDLVFGVSYCPYTAEQFWMDAQAEACDPKKTGTGTPKVNWWNLQCYAGGSGNTPNSWAEEIDKYIASNGNRMGIDDTKSFVIPGYGNDGSSAAQVEQDIHEAATGSPPTNGGGWIWQLGQFDPSSSQLESRLHDYAEAILKGLGQP